MTSKEGNMVTK